MKQTSFNDKITTRKGNVGERIVDEYLKARGWSIYKTGEGDGPHAFDRLAVKDKKHIIIAEVKSKAKMNKYDATGINETHFQEYLKIYQKYGIEIFLFFVDESPGIEAVYYQRLSRLIEPSKNDRDLICYPALMPWKCLTRLFNYALMKTIKKLTPQECSELRTLSSRSYNYQGAV